MHRLEDISSREEQFAPGAYGYEEMRKAWDLCGKFGFRSFSDLKQFKFGWLMSQDRCDSELQTLKARVAELEEVLEMIAQPDRPDGTYNRSREACEILAREALNPSPKEPTK